MNNNVFIKWFNDKKGKYITIEMGGRIFGGRYGESPQLLRGYEFDEGNKVKITFGTTEVLEIENPISYELDKHKNLIIYRANEVIFGWHYYGRPQTQDNRCIEKYKLIGDNIYFERQGILMPKTEVYKIENSPIVSLIL